MRRGPHGRGGSWYGSYDVVHPAHRSTAQSKRVAERRARDLSRDGQVARVLTDPTSQGGGVVIAAFLDGRRVRGAT